jgi:hypothetical protein
MFDLFPILLYPEIHYHLGFFYPLYFRRLPEILADLPYRIYIKKENSIPILIIVKDADKFPVVLNQVAITVVSTQLNMQKKIELSHNLKERYFSQIITVNFPEIDFSQLAEITATFYLTRKKDGKEFIFENDNLPGLHTRLTTLLSKESLPGDVSWYAGDPHFHSNFTADQVEFGADINSAVQLAKRMGLDWFFVTDHSYDLDDKEDNFLKQNPEFPKWQKMKQKVKTIQKMERFPVIFGEELSCGNSENKNVHLLVINNEKFIEGRGDGAEKWFRNKPTFQLEQVCKMQEKNSLIISAHSFESFPDPVQKILLRRGTWRERDITENKIQYLQILNRMNKKAIAKAKKKWLELLLKGYKTIILAGNDAHGHFNIKRDVRVPFLYLSVSSQQVFGNLKTYFKADDKLTPENFIKEFKKNRIVVSNGPFATFTINNYEIGSTASGTYNFNIKISANSSEEFGFLKKVLLYAGSEIDGNEEIVKNWEISHYKFSETLSISNQKQNYFRLEAYTDKNKFCWTNPIWIAK